LKFRHIVGLAGALLAVAPCLSCSEQATDVSFGTDAGDVSPGAPDHGGADLELVAAMPYHTVNGRRVPACSASETPEGFALSFNMKSTGHEGGVAGNPDLQIREGDTVKGQLVSAGADGSVNPGLFEVSLDCIEGYPDTSKGCEADDGVEAAPAEVTAVEFVARSSSRAQPVAVAILVDHSASTIGFGNQDRKEVKEGFPAQGKLSDPTHARYRAAVEGIVKRLKADDRLVAWAFDETGINLACTAPNLELLADPTERERACFGTNHVWVGGDINVDDPSVQIEGGFTQLAKGTIVAQGRTPLWAAVDHAWDFLHAHAKDTDGAPLPRHIVVITDSPDTCDPTSPHFLPDEPCAVHLPYRDVVTKVEAVPFEQRIPISFVQFQSHGYPQQDPAQMEIACLTGGTYKWVNRLAYADVSTQLEDALKSALGRIRTTFGGVWRVYVELPSLSEAKADGAALLPPGRVFAIDGELTLVSPSILSPQRLSHPFHLGAPTDNRLLLRRPCSAETDCPGGADGDCTVSCIPDGAVCAWPEEGETKGGLPVGEGGTCDPGDGTEGTCCCGTCQAPAAACVVNEAPCCDPAVDVLFCL
jgi:hypothetical protein